MDQACPDRPGVPTNLPYELLWIVPVHHIDFEDAAQADHDADPPVLPDEKGQYAVAVPGVAKAWRFTAIDVAA